MIASRFTVNLWPEERAALRELALQERRDPRDQAAIIIREVLTRRGLLAEGDAPAQSARVRTEGNLGQMANLPG